MQRVIFLLLLLLTLGLSTNIISSGATEMTCRNEIMSLSSNATEIDVRLHVRIKDIDISRGVAILRVIISVWLPYYNITRVELLISEDFFIQCNISNFSRSGGGISNYVEVMLDGYGENFPFDTYRLHIWISRVGCSYYNGSYEELHIPEDAAYTLIDTSAWFEGPKLRMLLST